MQIDLSIVIPTIDRKIELVKLLDSIELSNNYKFEILIIDQNPTDIISANLKKFENLLNIKHFRLLDRKGASVARNFGISQAYGKIICFPDDDCILFPNTIKLALKAISDQDCDVVFGKCIDENGNDSVIKWSKSAGFITRNNCDDKFVEATMFAKREIFETITYDEGLGVGTFHGSGEAYDLVLNMLDKKFSLYYNPNITFYHPNKVVDHSLTSSIRRVFSYSCGFGRLCIKHKLYKKLFKRLILVTGFIPVSYIVARKKTRYYCAELVGILSGIIIK